MVTLYYQVDKKLPSLAITSSGIKRNALRGGSTISKILNQKSYRRLNYNKKKYLKKN